MSKKKVTIALMYDFDKTLCTKDMQEYSFIPNLKIKAKDFWNEANKLASDKKMDRILAYMYLMIDKSNANHNTINREDFVKLGENVEFFNGVESWFKRINDFAKNHNVEIEHYIISSGLKEIIEGTTISQYFKEIYACEYYYNQNNTAVWPLVTVNYTTKTQFLFRINKGVLDISNDEALNEFIQDDQRRIPFRNMIYIGDGLTDVPCMKLVNINGGYSIAVYKKRKKEKVANLLTDKRVNFITLADYSENSEMDQIVKTIIEKMSVVNKLVELHNKQELDLKKDICVKNKNI